MAPRTTTLLVLGICMVYSNFGTAVDYGSQRNRVISTQKTKTRNLWHRTHDDLVSFMSVQGSEAEQLSALPKLPTLAGQLGLNVLVADVVKTGLTKDLSVRGSLTLLGPTDVAFATVPDWLKQAMENTTILTQILKYHILRDEFLFDDITGELTARTLQGAAVRFNVYPGNPSKVVTAQCASLDSVNVDKMASNGVLHELKQVMRPPLGTIVQLLSACPEFKTLVAAVEAADLADVLGGKGPFTLFAPTEAAFQKLDPQTLDGLLKNKTALTDLLEYHVTKKTYCSAGLVFVSRLQMLNGEQVNITVGAETVNVNDAGIVPAGVDGSVSNGVMHAIDTVLMPPSLRPDPPPLSSEPSDQQ